MKRARLIKVGEDDLTLTETRVAVIADADGSVVLDCEKSIFDITQTGDTTFSFINVPTVATISVHINRTGEFSDTWPETVHFQDDAAPAPSVGPDLKDAYTLETIDSGASWSAAPFVEGAPA